MLAQAPALAGRRLDLIAVSAALAAVVYVLSFLPTLLVWPAVNGDEGRELNAFWVASGIDPLARTLDPTYGHDPLYKGGLQGWTTGLSFRIFGLSLWSGRVVSLIWGGALLFVTFLAGRRLFGTAAGWLAAVFLAASQPFLVSTHIVRPDTVVAALAVFAFYLAVAGTTGGPAVLHIAAGITLGLAFDVHPNTIAFIPLVGLVYLLRQRWRVWRSRDVWLFAAGVALGAMYYLAIRVLPDPAHYADAFRYWVGVDKRPPALATFGWPMVLAEWSRFTSYYEGRVAEALLILVGIVGVIRRVIRREPLDPLLPGLLVAFVVFTVLVSSKTEYYMILFYPFLLLLLGRELAEIGALLRSRRLLAGMLLAVLIVAPMGFEDNLGDMTMTTEEIKDRDYFSLIREIRQTVPPGASVLAPPVYWPGLPDYPYVDYYVWERLRAERNVSFAEFAREVRPDYVLLDVKARFEVFRNSPRFMDEYAQLVTTIRHVGYGRVEVWKRRDRV